MVTPSYDDMKEMIEFRLNQTYELLEEFDYDLIKCTSEEFYAFLSGDKISNERITLRDIIGNEYMMVHVVVEISELKTMGLEINDKTVPGTKKESLYEAHLYLDRLIKEDMNLPEILKPVATLIYDNFRPFKDY